MTSRRRDDGLDAFLAKVRAGNGQALDVMAATLEAEIKQQLSVPGRGRYYGKARQASGASRARAAKTFNRRLRTYVAALNTGHFDVGDVQSSYVKNLHRASAPGDPPAPDTGALKRAVYTEISSATSRRVGVASAYAEPLEFGTTRGGRSRNVIILPRPFMRPAFAKVRERMAGQLREVFRALGGR
jgi:hypothetical protein